MSGIDPLPGTERIGVPAHLIHGRPSDNYVLRVVGDSMLEEGIFDGDYVVIERRQAAEPGEMIVALVGDDATLKFYFPEGDTVRLQPANAALEPLRVPARLVKIQGVAVGLMRQFKRREVALWAPSSCGKRGAGRSRWSTSSMATCG